ncbi:hypothetical protein CCH79_00019888 [Gambusia affinis]|uniref:CEMIP beta-helix domain-containing protein n=1 Tax=Gambusia affinis TaxID=33528 RepID=A0A315VQY0_GAMAF|nr:hypothetical protein CCH79_00019888 [Gambusia affinis]
MVPEVQRGFRAVHISGLELQYMGQQTMGHYPVHFHMNGDVDEKGGYNPPTFVSDLSIHHSFSRCVTIHGSNGLLLMLMISGRFYGTSLFDSNLTVRGQREWSGGQRPGPSKQRMGVRLQFGVLR